MKFRALRVRVGRVGFVDISFVGRISVRLAWFGVETLLASSRSLLRAGELFEWARKREEGFGSREGAK